VSVLHPTHNTNANTRPLEYTPLSRERFNTLSASADLPDDPDNDLNLGAEEPQLDQFQEALPLHRTMQAYDILDHQLRNDHTTGTLTRMLTMLAARAPATPGRDTLYGYWLPQIIGADRLTFYLAQWIQIHALPFQQVDNGQVMATELAQKRGSPSSDSGDDP
jgi:hypothetical protein